MSSRTNTGAIALCTWPRRRSSKRPRSSLWGQWEYWERWNDLGRGGDGVCGATPADHAAVKSLLLAASLAKVWTVVAAPPSPLQRRNSHTPLLPTPLPLTASAHTSAM